MTAVARFFLDTEFDDEQGNCRLEPISVGIISEDASASYYGVSSEFNESAAHAWLRENVISKLPPPGSRIPLVQMREEVLDYFRRFAPTDGTQARAEIWGRSVGMDQATIGLLFQGLAKFYAAMNAMGFTRTFFKDTQALRDQMHEHRLLLPQTDMPEKDRHIAIRDAENERVEYLSMRRTLDMRPRV